MWGEGISDGGVKHMPKSSRVHMPTAAGLQPAAEAEVATLHPSHACSLSHECR